MEQPKLEVTEVPVASLVPYAGNAKMHPPEQIDQIAASIREFGNCDPIAVWTNADGEPEIVEGHGRLLALQRLGIETAPVIRLDHLTDEQRRAYTHIHNQTTLNSGFDLDALAADIADLPAFDWGSFGFDTAKIFEPTMTLDDVFEDEVPTAPEARVKRGQVWELGKHRLMCGDSTSAEDIGRLMGGRKADLFLTDPPYNVSLGQDGGHPIRPSEARQLRRRTDGLVIQNDSFGSDAEFESWLVEAFGASAPSLKSGCPFYIWHASTKTAAFLAACDRSGFTMRQILVWVKSIFALGRQDYQWQHEPCIYGWTDGAAHYFTAARNEPTILDDSMDINKMSKGELKEALGNILQNGIETTVLRYAKPSASALHPTTKPVRLFARLVFNSSLEGDTILDPFGGSGTTLVAAEQLNRCARLMEIDPHYCDVIIQRWENLTGGKAVEVEAAS